MSSRIRQVAAKSRKLVQLLRHRTFVDGLVAHRVAATTEHLEPIRFTAANTLIDVGANKGQFSLAFRGLRPDAIVHAFEPLQAAALTFEALFRDDPRVHLHRCALGAEDTTARFFVADRADSSSLLRPNANQERAFNVRAMSEVEVPVRRLDSCLSLDDLPRPILMKVDVQGGEMAMLRGCRNLSQVDFIYVELSFVELYDGQPLFDDVYAFLVTNGFRLAGVFNQVSTSSFGPTQADFLFRRA